MEDCPICYESMTDINVCITICKHKFHTNCLMLCANVCPICRTNVGSGALNQTVIPAGEYSISEYLQELYERNLSIYDVPLHIKQSIEDHKTHEENIKKFEDEKKEKEERHKNYLKKTNIKKYKLFYGK